MIGKLFRWFFRLGALCIFAGVVATLPRVMPGVPWLFRLLWFFALVIAVDVAGLTMLATLIPRGSAGVQLNPLSPEDRRAAARLMKVVDERRAATHTPPEHKQGGQHAG